MNPTADSQVWNQFFFDGGDAALLPHCSIHTKLHSSGLPAWHKENTLGQPSSNASKKTEKKTNSEQSRQSRQLSFTGLSDYCFSRNGGIGHVVDVAGFLANETRPSSAATDSLWPTSTHLFVRTSFWKSMSCTNSEARDPNKVAIARIHGRRVSGRF